MMKKKFKQRAKSKAVAKKLKKKDNSFLTVFSQGVIGFLFSELARNVTITMNDTVTEKEPITEDADFTIIEPKQLKNGSKI